MPTEKHLRNNTDQVGESHHQQRIVRESSQRCKRKIGESGIREDRSRETFRKKVGAGPMNLGELSRQDWKQSGGHCAGAGAETRQLG